MGNARAGRGRLKLERDIIGLLTPGRRSRNSSRPLPFANRCAGRRFAPPPTGCIPRSTMARRFWATYSIVMKSRTHTPSGGEHPRWPPRRAGIAVPLHRCAACRRARGANHVSGRRRRRQGMSPWTGNRYPPVPVDGRSRWAASPRGAAVPRSYRRSAIDGPSSG